jgi:hypothetical protein
MRSIAYLLFFCVGLPGAAPALTVNSFTNDLTFNALCNQGTSDLDCESAVAELRIGDSGGGSEFERALRTPTPDDGFGNSAQGEFTWASGQAVDFSFGHDGNDVLTLTVGGQSLTMDMAAETSADADVLPLSTVDEMFIRTRSDDPAAGVTATLTDLTLTDAGGTVSSLPDNDPTAGGFQGAAYLRLSDFDWSAEWTLAGQTTFNFPDGLESVGSSALAHQFKLANIPLPAAGWLMLGGLGVLGLAARRRRSSPAG